MTNDEVKKEVKQRALRVVDFNNEQPAMALSRPGEGGLKPGDYIFEESESLYNEDVVINGEPLFKDNGDPIITMVAFISKAEKKNRKWVAIPNSKQKCYLSFLRKRFEVADSEGQPSGEYKESKGKVVDDVFTAKDWQEAWNDVLLGHAFRIETEDFKGFGFSEDKPKKHRVYICEWL
jgi:hypothetical protein